MTKLACLVAVLFSLFNVGCGDSSGGGKCCPMGEPSCGCFSTGGSPLVPGGQCGTGPCDAPPVGWVRGVDENGCPEWQCTPGALCGSGSCLQSPDTAGGD